MLGFLEASLLSKKLLLILLPGVLREKGIDRLLVSFLFHTISILGILTALSTMGVKIGPIIGGLGLGGFVLGFALKDARDSFRKATSGIRCFDKRSRSS